MDDHDDGEFYKEVVCGLVKETDDPVLLDLVYKILLEAKKVTIL